MQGGPRCFGRFSGCNLWRRPRAGSRHRNMPVLRHRFLSEPTEHWAAATPPPWLCSPTPIAAQWTGTDVNRYVVLTGGEPLLQVDAALIDALHGRGFSIGVETNGTIEPPDGMDWICVRPQGWRGA